MKKIDQAMILAAGFGKRMMPLTEKVPKPLIELNGVSMLERIINDLIKSGVKKIIINSHHKAEKINEFINNFSSKKDVLIQVIYEKEILETGGGVINALSEFDNKPMFIVNGDIIITNQETKTIYNNISEIWNDKKMDCLLLLQKLEDYIGYKGSGDFYLGKNNEILLCQKESSKKYVFAGVHITKPSNFEGINVQKIGLMSIYKSREFKRCFGFINPYGCMHVGDPESIKKAESYLSDS